ncbi:MAG: hypothetical protein HDQ91_02625 [Desulfovibrio sp.]|nr:hypothetical protein [Desulfovibrio sp.]
MALFGARDAETTLPCPECGKPLHIGRSCRQVFMTCPACGKEYPLKDFIGKADAAMEQFLENVYCDRI